MFEAIEGTYIPPLRRGESMIVAKAVRIDGATVMVDAKGFAAVSTRHGLRLSDMTIADLRRLCKIDLLSPKTINKWKIDKAKRQVKRLRDWDRDQFLRLAAKHGIKVPAEMRAAFRDTK